MAGHEVVVRPFSDVHRTGNKVVATLLHDPTVEGLDVALYMDGSASMENTYGPRGILAKLGPVRNQVEPQMQWMLEYLANKDRDGVLRVAYWATGSGADIEIVGDLEGAKAKTYKFPGPRAYGSVAIARAQNGRAFMAYRSLTALIAAILPNRYGSSTNALK